MKRKLWIMLTLAAVLALVCCGAAAEGDYAFISQPAVSDLDGVNLTYTVSWKTSFTPVKVEIIGEHLLSGNEFVVDTVTNGLSASMAYDIPADTFSINHYLIRAYYGNTAFDSKDREAFALDLTQI